MTNSARGPGRFRLRLPTVTREIVDPTPEQRAVIEHDRGRLRVLAGPGTGKTATLVEAVAERLQARTVPVEQMLVLTFSRRAAGELTDRITQRLGITTREPIVRTLHGYAYSLVRGNAIRTGEPAPRLLAAGESDQMVRELLAGQLASGRGGWPEAVGAALTSPAFAAELRDLMLRSAERGITPGRLAEIGRRRRRPEWQAAALFAREYQDVSDLRQGSTGLGAALDQAELTRAALGVLADDTVLAAEQARVRRVFIDEYQDVDPAQARLIDKLASGADELVVFGDPDQSIYAFRGSDPGALRDIDVAATVSLTMSRRLPRELLVATRRIAAALPGTGQHRLLTLPALECPHDPASGGHHGCDGSRRPAVDPGGLVVRTLPTAAVEAAFVADELRRAHLQSRIPWSGMAVLVRSPAAALPALRRAFATAGVPMAVSANDSVLSADPLVGLLITVLQCGWNKAMLTGQVALDLLASPMVGMDGDGIRRLRRRLRADAPDGGSTPDLAAAVLSGGPVPDDLPQDLAEPVLRVRRMLDAARAGAGDPAAETCLWQVWDRSGLADPLVAASLRGGRAGQRADATLDAVIGLFGVAADLAGRTPMAGVGALLDVIEGQRIAADPAAGPARSSEAVPVLSAHAAKGLEWDVVCIAGVAEGRWPVLRGRPSLLGADELWDAVAGVPAAPVDVASIIQEERRLFYVAATRARRRLVATSVADQDTVPSRFLSELAGTESEVESGWPGETDGSPRRPLTLTHLMAELRRAVSDPDEAAGSRRLAAAHLARLVAAGISGAHPRDWYGLPAISTSAPPIADGSAVRVSPSAVEALTECPLRAVLERRGARGPMTQQQIEGIVVHALVDGLSKGVAREELLAEMAGFLQLQTQLPPWLLARSRRALEGMLENAEQWIADCEPGRTLVGSEVPLSAVVPPDETGTTPEGGGDAGQGTGPAPGSPAREVRLEGRADRLDRAADGSLVVVDFKTGATPASKAATAQNAQLAVYQLAIALGGAPGNPGRSGGAELVFLRKNAVRRQEPLTPEAMQEWGVRVRTAAEGLASAVVLAKQNPHCERCVVRTSCPLQPEGRQVTR